MFIEVKRVVEVSLVDRTRKRLEVGQYDIEIDLNDIFVRALVRAGNIVILGDTV
jgi:hypothetical protein